MKRYAVLLSLAIPLMAMSAPAAAADPGIAEAVVQAQLNARNARDDIDVRDGKIAKVTFIMGTRMLDSAAPAKP